MSEPQQPQQPSELEMLRWDWSEAYSITIVDSNYCAVRRDDDSPEPNIMRAKTISGLRQMIAADHAIDGKRREPEINNHAAGS